MSSSDKSPWAGRADFKSQLPKWKRKAVCGREYIEVSKLRKWMFEGQPRNIDTLLEQSQAAKDDFSASTTTHDKVTRGRKRCLLMFSILLEIDAGYLVYDLRKHDICDADLPLDIVEVERTLRKLKVLKDKRELIPTLAQQFDEAQWKYFPLSFELGEEKDLNELRIVPILLKEELKEGGTAFVYQILVQEEFVDEPLQKLVPNARFDDREYGPVFSFVLKTYKAGNETLYENEMIAYKGLKANTGMIKCLFHFSHEGKGLEGDTAYNTVLEYGELDLTDYFTYWLPPILDVEQESFWSDLFLVAGAVKDIHEFVHPRSTGSDTYYGWHADIKPDNILNVQGEFKMADPGFARFERQPDLNRRKAATTYMGGTTTFGAPECFFICHQSSQEPPKVSRAIDIWSLGCVFSVAATWMVYGRVGLEHFDQVRKAAIRRIIDDKSLPENQKAKLRIDKYGDYFHDGTDVLKDVHEWHDFLRGGMRRNDRITAKVLKLVEIRMLRGDPADRISAKELCSELQNIKEETKTTESMHSSIRETLIRTEQLLAKSAEEEVLKAGNVKEAPKIEGQAAAIDASKLKTGHNSSRMLTPTLQTSHRSKAARGSDIDIHHHVPLRRSTTQNLSRIVIPAPLTQTKKNQDTETADETLKSPIERAETPLSPAEPSPVTLRTTPSSSRRRTRRRKSSLFSSISSMLSTSRRKSKIEETPVYRHLHDRYLVFLVDNGESMMEHWTDVQRVLSKLVDRAMEIEPPGMELHFTTTKAKFKPAKTAKLFAEEVAKPEHRPIPNTETNMSNPLSEILQKYLKTIDQHKADAPEQLLLVLTDGKWKAMKNGHGVDDQIVKFITMLKAKIPNLLEEERRRMGIQFVQFGHDKQAASRLRRLDNKLRFRGVPDIVDHKPSDTDIDRILISAVYESDDDEQSSEGEGEETNQKAENGRLLQAPDALHPSQERMNEVNTEAQLPERRGSQRATRNDRTRPPGPLVNVSQHH